MGKKLILAIVPAVVVGLLGATGAVLVQKRFLPAAVAEFLWPGLIALAFLAVAFLIFKLGARVWYWPPVVGFVSQVVGLFLLLLEVFDRWWEMLPYTFLAAGLAALVLVTIWLVALIRAQLLEKKMLASGPGGMDPAKTEEIRKNMREALDMLRKAGGRGRRSVYLLPWFLVVGYPGAGKTEAIRRSGLLSFRKDWIKGIGGTRTLNTFITNEMIFLDTPGRWVKEGSDEESRKEWLEVLRLLRKNRSQRPLDGIMVVVPLDHLLQKNEEELQDQASAVREVLDLLYDELKFRIPIYLVVSKSDLLEGFGEFFRNIDARQRDQAFGWSHQDPNRGRPPKLINRGMRRIHARLAQYRLEILAQTGSVRQARKLFFFTEEFRRVEAPLLAYADVLFERGRYAEPPLFRGFYFTSAMQGEGSPVSQAMSEMARSLGVRQVLSANSVDGTEKIASRQFFLLGLLRDLMAGDEGLVGRTVKDWYRRRKSTALITFAPAALGLSLVLFSGFSLLINRSTYIRAADRIPKIVSEIAGNQTAELGIKVRQILPRTEEIRGFHSRMAGFSPLRSWFGMRRPGRLRENTVQIYRRQLMTGVIDPTLRRAEEFALDPNNTVSDRIGVLHSVVWLRMARRFQWSGELNALDKVWDLPAGESSQAAEQLLRQFEYLSEQLPENEALLTTFSLAKVADSIAKDPQLAQASSPFDAYVRFQRSCRGVSGASLVRCWNELRGIARWRGGDYNTLRAHYVELLDDLGELARAEPGAQEARRILETVSLPAEKQGDCLGKFTADVVPGLAQYIPEEDVLRLCRSQVLSMNNESDRITTALSQQKNYFESRKKQAENAALEFQAFNEGCADAFGAAGESLDFEALKNVAESSFRAACRGWTDATPARTAESSGGGQSPGPSPPPAPGRPPASTGFRLLLATRGVGNFTPEAWQNKVSAWKETLAAAEGLPAPERRTDQDRVRREVETYAAQFVNAWREYLSGLTVRSNSGDIAVWMDALSQSGEFAQVLQRAAEAADAGGFGDPPFNLLGDRMKALGDLSSFANVQLREYQELLGQLASDLKKATTDAQAFVNFQQRALADDPTSSLIKAQNWVRANVGGSVAQGALTGLFTEPLVRARSFLQSGKAVGSGFDQLAKFYNEKVASAYPFAPKEGGDLLELELLKAFLGQNGLVQGLAKSVAGGADAGGVTAPAELWLKKAKRIADAVIGPDGEPKKLGVRISVASVTFEPAKLADDYNVKGVKLFLGEGAELKWAPDDGSDPKSLKATIWGPEASASASASITLEEKKLLKNKTEERSAVRMTSIWAPVKLLAKGQRNGNHVQLDLVAPLDEKGKKKVKATLEIEGEGLAALLDLAEHGLEPPPIGDSQ